VFDPHRPTNLTSRRPRKSGAFLFEAHDQVDVGQETAVAINKFLAVAGHQDGSKVVNSSGVGGDELFRGLVAPAADHLRPLESSAQRGPELQGFALAVLAQARFGQIIESAIMPSSADAYSANSSLFAQRMKRSISVATLLSLFLAN
jgi:hypothetical protein